MLATLRYAASSTERSSRPVIIDHPASLIGMETCCGSQHLARKSPAMGHTVQGRAFVRLRMHLPALAHHKVCVAVQPVHAILFDARKSGHSRSCTHRYLHSRSAQALSGTCLEHLTPAARLGGFRAGEQHAQAPWRAPVHGVSREPQFRHHKTRLSGSIVTGLRKKGHD